MNFDKGIIVSCQPRKGGFFIDDAWKFAAESQLAGAVALRIEGIDNIKKVSEISEVPIIGLVKYKVSGSLQITPTFSDAKQIVESGADYVAVDATGRNGFNHIRSMIETGYKIIGDIDTYKSAIIAQSVGCIAVTTALSGYTNNKFIDPFSPPDFKTLYDCCENLCIPVIAEGRYYDLNDVKIAYSIGAYAICIGAAITLPDKIIERFSKGFKWLS